jgi:hypothetical protein
MEPIYRAQLVSFQSLKLHSSSKYFALRLIQGLSSATNVTPGVDHMAEILEEKKGHQSPLCNTNMTCYHQGIVPVTIGRTILQQNPDPWRPRDVPSWELTHS